MILYKRGGCLSCGGGIMKHQNTGPIEGKKKYLGELIKSESSDGITRNIYRTDKGGERTEVEKTNMTPGSPGNIDIKPGGPGGGDPDFDPWFGSMIEQGFEGQKKVYPGTGATIKIERGKPPQQQTEQYSYEWTPMRPIQNLPQNNPPNINIEETPELDLNDKWRKLSHPIYAGIRGEENNYFARPIHQLSGPLANKYSSPQVSSFKQSYYDALNRGQNPESALKIAQNAAKEATELTETRWGTTPPPVRFFIHPEQKSQWKTFNKTFNEMFNVKRPNTDSSSFTYKKKK